MPSVVEKELYSLSTFPSLAHFPGGLTGWASDQGAAHSAVMGTHQNSSLAAAFSAKSKAELPGVGRMEVQDSIFFPSTTLLKIF